MGGDAKPSPVKRQRSVRGRGAFQSCSSDAVEQNTALNAAVRGDGRVSGAGRPTKKIVAPKRKPVAAGSKKSMAGKCKRNEDLQPCSSAAPPQSYPYKRLRSASLRDAEHSESNHGLSASHPQPQSVPETDLLSLPHGLAMTPFDPTKFTVGLSAYDAPYQDNVLLAPEYCSDIFQRLYNSEVGLPIFNVQTCQGLLSSRCFLCIQSFVLVVFNPLYLV